MLFSFNHKIGNIVIKDHVIRYVELKQRTPLIVGKYEERLIPKGIVVDGIIKNADNLSMILEQCVSEWGIKGRKVRFIVPDSHVVIRKIDVPADLKADEIRGHIYIEIGSKIHLPFEDAAFDFVELSKGEKSKSLLLFATSEELVQAYTEVLDDVNLKPIVADLSSLCCYRLYHENPFLKKNEPILLIQFDLFSENLCIFKNDKPEFMRNLLKEEQANDSKELLHIHVSEVIKEIEHVLNFYRFSLNQGNVEVRNFIVTGDHPEIEMIFDELKRSLSGSVQLLSNNVGRLITNEPIPYSFHLAAGLALKEVE